MSILELSESQVSLFDIPLEVIEYVMFPFLQRKYIFNLSKVSIRFLPVVVGYLLDVEIFQSTPQFRKHIFSFPVTPDRFIGRMIDHIRTISGEKNEQGRECENKRFNTEKEVEEYREAERNHECKKHTDKMIPFHQMKTFDLFLESCRYGLLRTSKFLHSLYDYFDVTLHDDRCLKAACFNGKAEIVKYLLSNGALSKKKNEVITKPLKISILNDDPKILGIFLQHFPTLLTTDRKLHYYPLRLAMRTFRYKCIYEYLDLLGRQLWKYKSNKYLLGIVLSGKRDEMVWSHKHKTLWEKWMFSWQDVTDFSEFIICVKMLSTKDRIVVTYMNSTWSQRHIYTQKQRDNTISRRISSQFVMDIETKKVIEVIWEENDENREITSGIWEENTKKYKLELKKRAFSKR